jgi:hypothetical protein
MSNFVKLTTRIDEGYLRTWVHADSIVELSQNSATQAENNEGTCEFVDGEIIELVAFNETIDSLA